MAVGPKRRLTLNIPDAPQVAPASRCRVHARHLGRNWPDAPSRSALQAPIGLRAASSEGNGEAPHAMLLTAPSPQSQPSRPL